MTGEPTQLEQLGARSGDKGGDANVGIWVREAEHWPWLQSWLTETQLRDCLPMSFSGQIERYELPNLRAVNFVLRGYLGEGAFVNVRLDNQAKHLGEQIRYRIADLLNWPTS